MATGIGRLVSGIYYMVRTLASPCFHYSPPYQGHRKLLRCISDLLSKGTPAIELRASDILDRLSSSLPSPLRRCSYRTLLRPGLPQCNAAHRQLPYGLWHNDDQYSNEILAIDPSSGRLRRSRCWKSVRP